MMRIMVNESCIFCKIVKNEIRSYKIWEDENYLSFLDIYPNIKGQTVVITKRHVKSNAYSIDENELLNLVSATKKVAGILKKKLGVKRVHLVIEGTGIDHLHAKLYPAIGYNIDKPQAFSSEIPFQQVYEGYITTQSGPKATPAYLEELQEELTT